MDGDVDIAQVASALGEPARARMVLALLDGRALAAGLLAREAHVAPSTASEHLGRLVQAGILTAEQWGRHRYYRMAGPEVASAIEALAQLAPTAPVRSLRGSDRLRALREARTCYDHLAGRLGVALMAAFLQEQLLTGGDGQFHPEAAVADRLSARGRDVDYRLTTQGETRLQALGIHPRPGGRLLTVRYCVDWSEQRHHLAGGLGAALLSRFFALDWARRSPHGRAITLTPAGEQGLARVLGLRGWRDAVTVTPAPVRLLPPQAVAR